MKQTAGELFPQKLEVDSQHLLAKREQLNFSKGFTTQNLVLHLTRNVNRGRGGRRKKKKKKKRRRRRRRKTKEKRKRREKRLTMTMMAMKIMTLMMSKK